VEELEKERKIMEKMETFYQIFAFLLPLAREHRKRVNKKKQNCNF
jgi:hypothetical protein